MAIVTFTEPTYLWFLFAVPVFFILHYLGERAVKKKSFRFSNYRAIETVMSSGRISRLVFRSQLFKYYTFLGMRTLILVLLILAAAGTTIHFLGLSSDFDFVLTVDNSLSMLADDLEPNRMEAAKLSAAAFADGLMGNTRMSLVTFSGVPSVDQMPTTDIGRIKEAINDIEVSRSGGTAIGDAIVTSSNLLYNSPKSKVIILLTDGRNNVGSDPVTALEYAKRDDIVIYTIGVGTEQGASFIPGINLTSTLDTTMLEQIANETSGKFYYARDRTELLQAYRNIASTSYAEVSINLSLWLLLAGFILLIVEWQLANLRYKVIP